MQDFNFSCKSLPCAIRTSEKKQLRYIYIYIYICIYIYIQCTYIYICIYIYTIYPLGNVLQARNVPLLPKKIPQSESFRSLGL